MEHVERARVRAARSHVERWWRLDEWRAEWRSGLRFLGWQHFDPERVAVELLGETPVHVQIEGGEMVAYGPWRLTIQGFEAAPGRRVLSTWSMHWVRATDAAHRAMGTRDRARPSAGPGSASTSSSARRSSTPCTERGASEAWRLGGSERMWLGASEWVAAGASETLWLGASETAWLGASERLGASEWLGASERAGASSFARDEASEPASPSAGAGAWTEGTEAEVSVPHGYLAIVLHAHLPFVRHPEAPSYMEEEWFFEAITETYVAAAPRLRAARAATTSTSASR